MSAVTVPVPVASAWDRVRTYRPPNRYLPILQEGKIDSLRTKYTPN